MFVINIFNHYDLVNSAWTWIHIVSIVCSFHTITLNSLLKTCKMFVLVSLKSFYKYICHSSMFCEFGAPNKRVIHMIFCHLMYIKYIIYKCIRQLCSHRSVRRAFDITAEGLDSNPSRSYLGKRYLFN